MITRHSKLLEEKGVHCVPAESELLTSRGFMDLDTYKAASSVAAADDDLLVAGYRAATQQLVFERPRALVEHAHARRSLVELGNASDVSLLVTRNHDLYVQCSSSSSTSSSQYTKMQADEVLSASRADTSLRVRQLTSATRGIADGAERVPDVVVSLLGAHRVALAPLVYELVGCWLACDDDARDAVRFGRLSTSTRAFVLSTLRRLDVRCDDDGADDGSVCVRDATWCAWWRAQVSSDHRRRRRVPVWLWPLARAAHHALLAGALRVGNVLSTRSAALRDDWLMLSLRVGHSATFARNVTDDDDDEMWTVTMHDDAAVTLSAAHGEIGAREHVGRVWCLSMPSGFVWTRRVERDARGRITRASRPVLTGSKHTHTRTRMYATYSLVYADSTFLLERQFHGPLRAAIERALSAAETSLETATRHDSWQSAPVFVLDTLLAPTIGADGELRRGATLQLSESGRELYAAMQRLLRGTTRIVTLELTPTLASGYERFVVRYVQALTRAVRSGRLSAAASVAALTNAANVVGELVPRIVEAHQRALGDVPLRSMEEMAEAVERAFDEFVELFGTRTAEDIVYRK